MKPKSTLRNFLAIAGCATITLSSAQADIRYWDGGTVDIDTPGNGLSDGTAGNWNTSLLNWDQGSGLAHVAWDNTDTLLNPADTAVFSGPAGTVTLTAPITVGGLQFKRTAYNITTGANTLSFGTGDNTILLDNTAAATITGIVGGTGNVILKASNPATGSGTITFTGASSGGWSGTTTINPSMILTTTSTSGNVNRVLDSTSGITLNGGRIQFNRATNANLNAISDTAAITVNGGGTFSVTSADAGGVNAIENIGAVTVNSGQMNFNWTNGASSGAQIIMSGLTTNGTSALTFSGNLGSTGRWKVTGAGTTAANGIIGSWATTGGANGIAAQTDYAVYSGDFVAAANIASSAQSTWSTVHAATSNYTMGAAGAPGETLTEARNINSLRLGAAASAAANSTSEFFTIAGNTFSNGDVIGASGTGGLTAGTPYFVIDKDVFGADTFRVSLTAGGVAVGLSNTTAGQIAGAFSLAGSTLGTNGILNGTAAPLIISGGGGVITLPTTTSGNLYVTAGAGAISIDAPINDNGAGVLTLVKSGNAETVLRNNSSNYSGGTVLNAGTLTYTNDNQLGLAGSRNITVNGTATLTGFDNSSLGQLSVSAGAIANITARNLTFATATGSGTVLFNSGNKTLSLQNASSFQGNLRTFAGGNGQTIQFGSIGDAVGAGNLQYGGGSNDNGQTLIFRLYNNAGPQVFNNRSIEIFSRDQAAGTGTVANPTLQNANGNALNTFIINTDLVNSSARDNNFILGGANTGNNQFNGVIGNSTKGAFHSGTGALSLTKADAGKWILGGANTYTGNTTVSAGTLEIGGSGTLGNVSAGVGNYAGNISIASTNSGRLVYNSTATQTLGGVISGAGAVFVEDGTLTLSNASNSYTGTTTVNDGGTLLINGITSSTSVVTVNVGGAIGGTGSIGSTLSLIGGSFHVVDLLDALQVTGTVSIYAGFGVDDLVGLTWGSVDAGTYTLINGTLGVGVFDALSHNTPGTAFDVGFGKTAYFQEGSLQLVVIPEPSAALLGGLGVLLLLRRRR